MSTINWILFGIGTWCAVSVGVGVMIGRFLQAGQSPRPVAIFRISAAQQRVRALGQMRAGAVGGVVARPRRRRRPASDRGPGPSLRPPEASAPSSPRHGPRRPAPAVTPLVHSHATRGDAPVDRLPVGSALLTWSDDVASDDVLLDRVAMAPLASCPLVDDGAGGQLAARLMAWRRQVDEINLPTQRRPTSME